MHRLLVIIYGDGMAKKDLRGNFDFYNSYTELLRIKIGYHDDIGSTPNSDD